jgi:hypothetical protein
MSDRRSFVAVNSRPGDGDSPRNMYEDMRNNEMSRRTYAD